RQALRVSKHLADRRAGSLAHQALMHGEQYLAADVRRRGEQQIEAAPDRAIRRVLDRHHAVACLTPLPLAEHLVDRSARHAAHARAKVLERRLFAERAAWPKERDRECLLQRTAGRDDLGEQARHGLSRQWSAVALLQALHHLSLALGAVDRPVALQLT